MPIPKVLRALFISAVATGAAAALLKALGPAPRPAPRVAGSAGPFVEADRMSEGERHLLLAELDSHL